MGPPSWRWGLPSIGHWPSRCRGQSAGGNPPDFPEEGLSQSPPDLLPHPAPLPAGEQDWQATCQPPVPGAALKQLAGCLLHPESLSPLPSTGPAGGRTGRGLSARYNSLSPCRQGASRPFLKPASSVKKVPSRPLPADCLVLVYCDSELRWEGNATIDPESKHR